MVANETRAWVTHADGSGWLLGVSYTGNRTRLLRSFVQPGQRYPLPGVSNRLHELTAYGEASVRLTPAILLTSGARVSRSVLSGAAEDAREQIMPIVSATAATRQEWSVLPSASLLVDLHGGASAFLRYQQGFRPGGLAVDDDYIRRFDSDRVSTIEAGYRFGRAARDPFALTLTIAHTDWRNIQADFLDSGNLPSTANIGNGDVWTVEASGAIRLAKGWRVEGAVSLNDSSVNERGPNDLPLQDASAGGAGSLRPIPNIADITARIGMIYETALSDRSRLKIDGWLRYIGLSRLGLGPLLGDEQGNYADSAVTARMGWDRFGVTVGVTNILNARGNRFAMGTPFVTGKEQITPIRPRTIRIGLDTAF